MQKALNGQRPEKLSKSAFLSRGGRCICVETRSDSVAFAEAPLQCSSAPMHTKPFFPSLLNTERQGKNSRPFDISEPAAKRKRWIGEGSPVVFPPHTHTLFLLFGSTSAGSFRFTVSDLIPDPGHGSPHCARAQKTNRQNNSRFKSFGGNLLQKPTQVCCRVITARKGGVTVC